MSDRPGVVVPVPVAVVAVVLWCLIFTHATRRPSDQKDDELCKVITKTTGDYACKPIDQCPAALRDFEDFAVYPKVCRFRGQTPVVCCPTAVANAVPGRLAAEKCKEYYSMTTMGGGTIDAGSCRLEITDDSLVTIVGGIESVEGEFPHMVILGTGKHVKDVEWSCGGSLISDRYVLSAAHCSNTGNKDPVKWALLGDHDVGSDEGDADPQIREILRRITHPDYRPSSVYDDIVLYQLNAPVRFNRYVLPVCLNTETQLSVKQVVAIGWGRTSSAGLTSNVLMKVSLNLVDQNICNSSYLSTIGKRLESGINPNSQICAGKLEGGKDTCQGDSGGPLLTGHPEFDCMYLQVGITSFGKLCGIPDAPGVYTRVSNYVSWIESVVWPTSSSSSSP